MHQSRVTDTLMICLVGGGAKAQNSVSLNQRFEWRKLALWLRRWLLRHVVIGGRRSTQLEERRQGSIAHFRFLELNLPVQSEYNLLIIFHIFLACIFSYNSSNPATVPPRLRSFSHLGCRSVQSHGTSCRRRAYTAAPLAAA